MTTSWVNLTQSTPYSYVEAVTGGWLFLAPFGDNQAILQGMVPDYPHNAAQSLTNLLTNSRHIAPQITQFGQEVYTFQASPALTWPFIGPKWIAVGDAAFSVDPLMGDGTGSGIRGTLLAVATINAFASSESKSSLNYHYLQRLARTFQTHLMALNTFYTTANFSKEELWLQELAYGHLPLPEPFIQASKNPRFSYTLKNRNLHKISFNTF
jgi:flavin-dependent dehydrogenase